MSSKNSQLNLQQIQQQMGMLEQQAENLEQQKDHFYNLISSTRSSISTLKGIENPFNKSEFLLPLSGGIYVKAKLLDYENVLINVGSGVVIPKSVDEGMKILEQKITDFENFIKKLDEELNKVIETINNLQQMVAQAQQQSQNKGITPDSTKQ
jgi:prefoldin alpha subunit